MLDTWMVEVHRSKLNAAVHLQIGAELMRATVKLVSLFLLTRAYTELTLASKAYSALHRQEKAYTRLSSILLIILVDKAVF